LTFVTSCLHDFFFSVSLLKLFIFSMSRSLIHQFFCSLRRINWEFVANVLPSIFFSFLVKKLGKASSLLFSYAIFKVLPALTPFSQALRSEWQVYALITLIFIRVWWR